MAEPAGQSKYTNSRSAAFYSRNRADLCFARKNHFRSEWIQHPTAGGPKSRGVFYVRAQSAPDLFRGTPAEAAASPFNSAGLSYAAYLPSFRNRGVRFCPGRTVKSDACTWL